MYIIPEYDGQIDGSICYNNVAFCIAYLFYADARYKSKETCRTYLTLTTYTVIVV